MAARQTHSAPRQPEAPPLGHRLFPILSLACGIAGAVNVAAYRNFAIGLALCLAAALIAAAAILLRLGFSTWLASRAISGILIVALSWSAVHLAQPHHTFAWYPVVVFVLLFLLGIREGTVYSVLLIASVSIAYAFRLGGEDVSSLIPVGPFVMSAVAMGFSVWIGRTVLSLFLEQRGHIAEQKRDLDDRLAELAEKEARIRAQEKRARERNDTLREMNEFLIRREEQLRSLRRKNEINGSDRL